MSGRTVMLGKCARSLIAWVERYADPADREWIEAMRAELESVDGGFAQVRWAAGSLLVLWRPYRVDFLRFMLCIAAVVFANYWYPKIAPARPVELFFFVQQFYLPVVGILVANATRRILAGTVVGIGLSLLGLGVMHGLGYGTSTSILVDGLFFVIVGAAFGTAGAATLRLQRIAQPGTTTN